MWQEFLSLPCICSSLWRPRWRQSNLALGHCTGWPGPLACRLKDPKRASGSRPRQTVRLMMELQSWSDGIARFLAFALSSLSSTNLWASMIGNSDERAKSFEDSVHQLGSLIFGYCKINCCEAVPCCSLFKGYFYGRVETIGGRVSLDSEPSRPICLDWLASQWRSGGRAWGGGKEFLRLASGDRMDWSSEILNSTPSGQWEICCMSGVPYHPRICFRSKFQWNLGQKSSVSGRFSPWRSGPGCCDALAPQRAQPGWCHCRLGTWRLRCQSRWDMHWIRYRKSSVGSDFSTFVKEIQISPNSVATLRGSYGKS